MIDLERSSRCRRRTCNRRAMRAGLCLEHLPELAGPDPLPWPSELAPTTWRERALIRRIGTTGGSIAHSTHNRIGFRTIDRTSGGDETPAHGTRRLRQLGRRGDGPPHTVSRF